MSALSVVRDGNKAVTLAANPLYLISAFTTARGGQVIFEILEADAGGLQRLVGTKQLYYLEEQLFWGQLESLEPCESTHPTLSTVACTLNKKTMRGVFSILGETDTIN
jgi:hypothetical protein